jgi:hypothetical protein
MELGEVTCIDSYETSRTDSELGSSEPSICGKSTMCAESKSHGENASGVHAVSALCLSTLSSFPW